MDMFNYSPGNWARSSCCAVLAKPDCEEPLPEQWVLYFADKNPGVEKAGVAGMCQQTDTGLVFYLRRGKSYAVDQSILRE